MTDWQLAGGNAAHLCRCSRAVVAVLPLCVSRGTAMLTRCVPCGSTVAGCMPGLTLAAACAARRCMCTIVSLCADGGGRICGLLLAGVGTCRLCGRVGGNGRAGGRCSPGGSSAPRQRHGKGQGSRIHTPLLLWRLLLQSISAGSCPLRGRLLVGLRQWQRSMGGSTAVQP